MNREEREEYEKKIQGRMDLEQDAHNVLFKEELSKEDKVTLNRLIQELLDLIPMDKEVPSIRETYWYADAYQNKVYGEVKASSYQQAYQLAKKTTGIVESGGLIVRLKE